MSSGAPARVPRGDTTVVPSSFAPPYELLRASQPTLRVGEQYHHCVVAAALRARRSADPTPIPRRPRPVTGDRVVGQSAGRSRSKRCPFVAITLPTRNRWVPSTPSDIRSLVTRTLRRLELSQWPCPRRCAYPTGRDLRMAEICVIARLLLSSPAAGRRSSRAMPSRRRSMKSSPPAQHLATMSEGGVDTRTQDHARLLLFLSGRDITSTRCTSVPDVPQQAEHSSHGRWSTVRPDTTGGLLDCTASRPRLAHLGPSGNGHGSRVDTSVNQHLLYRVEASLDSDVGGAPPSSKHPGGLSCLVRRIARQFASPLHRLGPETRQVCGTGFWGEPDGVDRQVELFTDRRW